MDPPKTGGFCWVSLSLTGPGAHSLEEAAARRQYLPGADDPEPPVPTEDLSPKLQSSESGGREMDLICFV